MRKGKSGGRSALPVWGGGLSGQVISMWVLFFFATICLAASGPSQTVPAVEQPISLEQQAEIISMEPIPTVSQVATNTMDSGVPRSTTVGGVPVGPEVNFPDLLRMTIGLWSLDAYPVANSNGYYDGVFNSNGDFFRLDLVFDGLINPPGTIDSSYDPKKYGISPLFGTVELDVDLDVQTGGEAVAPKFRYNANVARFGGRPRGGRYTGRISTDGREVWDGSFNFSPAIHRSGADFLLVFDGENVTRIDHVTGDADHLFEAGERWLVHGYFFQRSSAYYEVSYMGSYSPAVTVGFAHDEEHDATIVTLVYPLNNTAYAGANGTNVQANNFDDSDANSIMEALTELKLSAETPPIPTHPYMPTLEPWAGEQLREYLNPSRWRLTALVGGVLENMPTDGVGIYVWSDVCPGVRAGDFNGDGLATNSDADMATEFLLNHDGDIGYDSDSVEGQITLVEFGPRFSIYDVDYDGFVDQVDLEFSLQDPSDYDNDENVDLLDFWAFQRCYSESPLADVELCSGQVCSGEEVAGPTGGRSAAPTVDPAMRSVGCLDAFDSDGDRDIDAADYEVFRMSLSGP